MKKTNRNKIITLLATLCAFCLFLGVGATSVFATETTKTVDQVNFTIQQGAYIRLKDADVENENGLRYGITMLKEDYTALKNNVGNGKAYQDLSFGILLAPASYESGAITLRDESFINNFYWAVKNNEGEWEVPVGTVTTGKKQIMNFESSVMVDDATNVGYVRYYGSMTNILDTNLDRDFIGVGYIKYVDGTGTHYTFADDNDNTRSIAYVASKAVNLGEVEDEFIPVVQRYINGAIDTELAFTNTTPVKVDLGKTLQLNLNAKLNVKYQSLNADIATVSNTGLVTGVSEGTATIKATIGTLYSCQTEITVEDNRTLDDLLAEYYIPDDTAEVEYMLGVGAVSVQNVSDTQIESPAGFDGSTYLQYDIENKGYNANGNYHGFAIAIDNGSSLYSKPASTALQNKFSAQDYSNAYIGFWVYNDSDYKLNMYAQHDKNFSTEGTEIEVTKNRDWTYVEWALTEFDAKYTSNPFVMESYFFRLGFGYKETVIKTSGSLQATFYIAGFDIYNKGGSVAISNTDLANHVVSNGQEQYVNSYTTMTADVVNETGATANSNSYVSYTITGNGHTVNLFGCPVLINTKTISGNTSITKPLENAYMGSIAKLDWNKDVYLGFWAKNTDNTAKQVGSNPAGNGASPLMFIASTTYVGADYDKQFIRTLTGNDWTYIEIPLKDIGVTSNPFDESLYNINVMAAYVGGSSATASYTFYIDGLAFYNRDTVKTKNDMLVEHLLYNTNTKHSESANAFGAATATVENFASSIPEGVTDTNYIKYSISGGVWKTSTSTNYAGHIIDFSGYRSGISDRKVANTVSSELQAALSLPSGTIQNVSFYVKNDSAFTVKFAAYNAKVDTYNTANLTGFVLGNMSGAGDTCTVTGNSDWKKITIDISALGLTASNFDSATNCLAIGYYVSGQTTATASFSITGFTLA